MTNLRKSRIVATPESRERGVMKATAIALSALLLSGYAATDNFNRVARIFGRDIFITDLNPTDDELRMVKRSRQDLSNDQIVSEVRSEKLAHRIWDPIWTQFDKTHDVKPTEAEIDDHVRAMEAFTAMDPDRRLPDDPKISAKMKKGRKRRCRIFCQAVEKKQGAL